MREKSLLRRHISATLCFSPVYCMTLCWLCLFQRTHCDDTKEKNLKVWRTGLTNGTGCCFGPSFGSLSVSMYPAWIQLFQFLAGHPGSWCISRLWVPPWLQSRSLTNWLRQIPLPNFYSSGSLLSFLYIWLPLYQWRGEYTQLLGLWPPID